MPVNSDKPHLWKADIVASIDQFNEWFMKAAPQAFRDSRVVASALVEDGVRKTGDLTEINPATLRVYPKVLKILRMSCCPPLARDRLAGLAGVSKTFLQALEEGGKIPPRAKTIAVDEALRRLTSVITQMLDFDIFPWIGRARAASNVERQRASTIIADRLCGALSDPIIRNAQERRQLELIANYLISKGYRHHHSPAPSPLTEMEVSTFAFRLNVVVARGVKIPIDAVIQPPSLRGGSLPILVEAKSAGDSTNVNKRRKEEATKIRQLREVFGDGIKFILFLCGYFDTGYLGYEAAEGIDWVWEHRIKDFDQSGI